MKIQSFQIENIKRVRTVALEPRSDGLTVIGGGNGQGKTSILDAIAFALGGKRHAPTNPKRDGAAGDPYIKITMDNGIVVERKGRNSSLVVTDPTGAKAGQALLNSFVSELAIDLPAFMKASEREKAKGLMGVLGIGEKMDTLEQREKALFDQRHDAGVTLGQKKKQLLGMPAYEDAPDEPVSVQDLIRRQQAAIERNSRNRILRESAARIRAQLEDARARAARLHDEVTSLEADLARVDSAAAGAEDEPTAELEAAIASAEDTNAKVRANAERERVKAECATAHEKYDALAAELASVRNERVKLLDGAKLPLDGLAISDGCLLYKGQRWDGMSGAERLTVAVAVASAINPKCGFVLLDELEKFDMPSMERFGKWLEEHGLQAICTRVSSGDECTIVIEDGMAHHPEVKFTPGQF